MKKNLQFPTKKAFTIVELLIVIAVIGIMSALVISSFSGAAQDTRRVVARQQQAAVQSAVNAWVTSTSTTAGISGALSLYNTAGNSMARLNLVSRYLDDSTVAHFTLNSGAGGAVKSVALKKIGQQIDLPTWSSSSYPKVELVDTPAP